mmetsp:Transcript_41995/g.120556  ORF Transcript_41995/g.120556 Transcript_41995/m.120556 type:complete len:293 (-) Transcript_41995:411-1289(-)
MEHDLLLGRRRLAPQGIRLAALGKERGVVDQHAFHCRVRHGLRAQLGRAVLQSSILGVVHFRRPRKFHSPAPVAPARSGADLPLDGGPVVGVSRLRGKHAPLVPRQQQLRHRARHGYDPSAPAALHGGLAVALSQRLELVLAVAGPQEARVEVERVPETWIVQQGLEGLDVEKRVLPSELKVADGAPSIALSVVALGPRALHHGRDEGVEVIRLRRQAEAPVWHAVVVVILSAEELGQLHKLLQSLGRRLPPPLEDIGAIAERDVVGVQGERPDRVVERDDLSRHRVDVKPI